MVAFGEVDQIQEDPLSNLMQWGVYSVAKWEILRVHSECSLFGLANIAHNRRGRGSLC